MWQMVLEAKLPQRGPEAVALVVMGIMRRSNKHDKMGHLCEW